ncbi:PilN domain-containing protein [Halorhodospira neutriphila]|uniref:PilN domain-containing protein n=1 Tax=Halorhodospira neutriphila TaxID=168379 RepID=UPI001902EEBA
MLERLQRLWGRGSAPSVRVGVHFTARSVAIAAIAADGRTLSVCDWREAGSAGQAEALAHLVDAHDLQGAPATLVVDEADYQTQQLEIPGVPDEELVEAARFRVRDSSSTPLEQARVAAYRLYSDRKEGGGAMVAVVLARSQRIDALVSTAEQAGLAPQRVLPPEAALHNLGAQAPEPASLLVLIGRSGGTIAISRGEHLYLARPHKYGVERLARQSSLDYEGLVLEVQRSIDYYEAQLASVEASQVLLLPAETDPGPLLDRLNEGVTVPAARLDLGHILDLPDEAAPDEAAQAHGVLAAAAALPAAQPATASFYVPPPKRVDWLAAPALAAYLGGLLAVLAALYAGQAYLLGEREAELAGLERQRDALVAEIGKLEQRLAERKPDQRLVDRYDALERELRLKRRFAEELAGMSERQRQGFSPILEGLARQRVARLWLTDFTVGAERLRLHGRATHPRLVPRFLDALAREPAFSGTRFADFRMQRLDAEGHVEFRIATDTIAADTGEGEQ